MNFSFCTLYIVIGDFKNIDFFSKNCKLSFLQKEKREILAFFEEKEIDPAAFHFVQRLK